MSWSSRSVGTLAVAVAGPALVLGCPTEVVPHPLPAAEVREWQTVGAQLPSALLSVATVGHEVFAVGADKGVGRAVAHFDGSAWTQIRSGVRGDLWWIHVLGPGSAVAVGQGALVVRIEGTNVTRLPTHGFAKQTLYGAWGKSADDFYVVGSAAGRDGLIWHWDGTRFIDEVLPADRPRANNGELPGLFKVWGTGDEVWAVGSVGTILHRKGAAAFETIPSGVTDTLFTVHGQGSDVFAVGGGNQGTWLQRSASGAFVNITPVGAPLLQGLFATDLAQVATGEKGQIFVRDSKGTIAPLALTLASPVQSLHSVATDAQGDLWSVGGNVLTPALDAGVMVHYAPKARHVSTLVIDPPETPETDAADPKSASCPPAELAAFADLGAKSTARQWDELILSAIRRDLPRPTVHARNLYHLSAALWDVFTAYEPSGTGVFVNERRTSGSLEADRREAMSYAAYRIIDKRYGNAIGGPISAACVSAFMSSMGYDPHDTQVAGDGARAFGNRVAATILAQTAGDGANDANNCADPTPFKSVNSALVIDEPSASPIDVNVWQPLNLSVAATQNGIILPSGVQGYIGSHWGAVKPFAMTRATTDVPWHDPGPSPRTSDPAMRAWLTEVIQRSSEMDVSTSDLVDIAPSGLGQNSLGTNDGTGYAKNPITGVPYTEQKVARGDYGRVLAEFWADGPKSETPPGHWNVLANLVADAPQLVRKIEGNGPSLSALAWDVHVYLALNGALHDAAIAAWDIKRRTLAPRPITLIRALAALGQSSEPALPHYHPDGLGLVPGLIEVITAESSAPGARHAHLRAFLGTIAVRSWRGEPGDRAHEFSGAGWIRAVDWMPYQRRTFVTPAFPGFISGHSTFSRAAAEVLADLTGSPYFPGGLAEVRIPQDTFLSFEKGPSAPLKLQWASYGDAADQAGQSRIWGGIHLAPDDFAGRRAGFAIGRIALAKAKTYY